MLYACNEGVDRFGSGGQYWLRNGSTTHTHTTGTISANENVGKKVVDWPTGRGKAAGMASIDGFEFIYLICHHGNRRSHFKNTATHLFIKCVQLYRLCWACRAHAQSFSRTQSFLLTSPRATYSPYIAVGRGLNKEQLMWWKSPSWSC